ncbi:MAG TPA: DNA-binding response regulator [Gallionellaceae bacterium]|jgi:DNA-binding NarL/FixJ family response regulator|nr:DNA-binding response regulator [Gallionellaceae bacterium]
MIKLLIVDDHAIVRSGLKQLFLLMGDIVVAGEASNGAEALEALRNEQFDLLLLDLTMPGISGIGLIGHIRAINTKVPILVLSMHCELQVAKRALQAGASGFVTKGCMPDTLVNAVRNVASGGRFVDPVISEQMMFEKRVPGENAPHERLSERELHVMKLIALGKSIKEIANELFISNKTISTHKARVMQKMNFQSSAEMIRYAADYGLVE